MDTKILIPSSPSEITPKWIHLVTGDVCTADSISIESNIQEGIGFLSSIYRVTYKTFNETRSIVVKKLPEKPYWLNIALADGSDLREIQFYSNVLPDILEVMPSLQEHLCHCYLSKAYSAEPTSNTTRASILVLDDLRLKGFKMMPFSGDGSGHIIAGLLSFLAKLHFSVYATSVKQQKPVDKLYPFLQGITHNPKLQAEIETMTRNSLPNFEKLLKAENLEHVWNKYQKLISFTKEIWEKVDKSGKQYGCLVHADVWPPNIQMHDTLPVKVLDWQLMGYRDPVCDLSIMLYCVLPKDMLSRKNLEQYVKIYWENYEMICKENLEYGDRAPRRSLEELKDYFFTWGAAYSYVTILPGFEQIFVKDWAKYVNVMRVLCEEVNVCDWLLGICQK